MINQSKENTTKKTTTHKENTTVGSIKFFTGQYWNEDLNRKKSSLCLNANFINKMRELYNIIVT